MSRRTISQLIEQALESSGYRDHALGLEWGERRIANIHKLLRLARRFEATEGRDLRGFLDQVTYLQRAAAIEPDAPVEGVEPDAVRLMTIHAAKGSGVSRRLRRRHGSRAQQPDLRPAARRRPHRSAPDAPRRRGFGSRTGVRRADGRAEAEGRGGGGPHSLRRHDPSPRSPAAVRLGKAREMADRDRVPDRMGRCPRSTRVCPSCWQQGPSRPCCGWGRALSRCGYWFSGPVPRRPCRRRRPACWCPARSAPRHAHRWPSHRRRSPAASRHRCRARTIPTPAPVLAASLSYSSLSEFERCGYRFYLERVLRLAGGPCGDPRRGGAGGPSGARCGGRSSTA